MRKKTSILLYGMIAIFVLIIAFFFVPENRMRRMLFPVVGILGLLFLALGIVLIVFSRKEKGKLKLFLKITGYSAIAPLLFSVLHNFFYGLAITFEKLAFIFEPLHAISFIISIIAAPILFIIGAVGSIILRNEKRTKSTRNR